MAWATAFKNALDQQVMSPEFIVKNITFNSGEQPGGTLALSTAKIASYDQVLEGRTIQMGEQRLDLRSWTWSGGEWSFSAFWYTAAQRTTLRQNLERGMPLQLMMGMAFYAVGDYEVLALGVVVDIVEIGREVKVRCWDLLSVLRVRITKDTWPALFGYLNEGPHSAVAATDYVAGTATIEVADASGFECDSATGVYLLRVTPDSGDPFLLLADNVTANVFDVTTTGQYGTTVADAAIGAVVESVPLITGTPAELARKVLTSTGVGINGSEDTLPESWGYGLDSGRCNDSDMDTWDAQCGPSAGAHAWVWIAATLGAGTWSAPVADPNGMGTLQDWMSRVGVWLCMRQGQITLRGVQNIWGGGSLTRTGWTITDQEIIHADSSVEWRAAEAPFEWLKARVLTATAASSPEGRSTNATWPLENVYDADLSAVVWDNESTQRDSDRDRIKYWRTKVPEVLRLRIAGWRFLERAVGDLVYVNSAMLKGHLDNTETLDGTVDWTIVAIKSGQPKPYVDVTLAIPPEGDADEQL